MVGVGEIEQVDCRDLELAGIVSSGAGGGGFKMAGANAECERDVLRTNLLGGLFGVGLRSQALFQIVHPSVEVVDPGLDGKAPGTELVDNESGSPEIVGKRGE